MCGPAAQFVTLTRSETDCFKKPEDPGHLTVTRALAPLRQRRGVASEMRKLPRTMLATLDTLDTPHETETRIRPVSAGAPRPRTTVP